MSWDSYIDNLVDHAKDSTGTYHCDKACIIGLNGGAPWTSATHANALQLQGSEGADIATCFKSGDFQPMKAGGIHVEGVKYFFDREEESKVAMGKMIDGKITLQKSKTAIVIARTPKGQQQGNTNKAVAIIAEYLESMNL